MPIAFFQDSGLVPIVEPEILLDGEHDIDRTYDVAEKVWAEVFFYLAQNNVMFEGIFSCFSYSICKAEKINVLPDKCTIFSHRYPPETEHGDSRS